MEEKICPLHFNFKALFTLHMSKYIDLNEAKQATVLPPALEERDMCI